MPAIPTTAPPPPADLLNRLLDEGGVWKHGSLSNVSNTRIGEDYGFAGTVFRVSATSRSGPVTLVAKVEDPEQVDRTVAAYLRIGAALEGRVPSLLGHSGDTILFEDISNGTQGDALLGAGSQQTNDLTELIADLHAATWNARPGDFLPPTHWDQERWDARMRVAGERYPDQLTGRLEGRLRTLHEEIPTAVATIAAGPLCWTHGDVHLDNVLWRSDGSVVLLDWANAAVRSPAADIPPLLGLSPAGGVPPGETLSRYRAALQVHGVYWEEADALETVLAGARILVRGLVGFAGYPEEPGQPRLLAARDAALEYTERALAWIDEMEGSS